MTRALPRVFLADPRRTVRALFVDGLVARKAYSRSPERIKLNPLDQQRVKPRSHPQLCGLDAPIDRNRSCSGKRRKGKKSYVKAVSAVEGCRKRIAEYVKKT